MNQSQEYNHTITLLKNALHRLKEALQDDPSLHNTVIDGTIQRFEFTIELFWKALKKKLLRDYGVDTQGPKMVLQQAYVNKLITDEKMWLDMLDDRNVTSHTYNQKLAEHIYANIKNYGPFLQAEFERIFS
jgi:nucleotidyltransferase substrate binding protein (TIGR01987 family)